MKNTIEQQKSYDEKPEEEMGMNASDTFMVNTCVNPPLIVDKTTYMYKYLYRVIFECISELVKVKVNLQQKAFYSFRLCTL